QMPQIFFQDDPDFRIGFAFADGMIRRGVHFHPWHNMFMNAAMTAADIDFALDQADAAFGEVRANISKIEPHPVLMALMKH
ncbi:MAG: glutamate-1-semialdehyde 2,1-aminomutase, partial [Proteobacteria bacterium]|nr:glutamate-1-semialdehyde 2,1-aminomutase [Pseudomonadota bacterium]